MKSDVEIIEIINNSKSRFEAAQAISSGKKGSCNYQKLTRIVNKYELDTRHWVDLRIGKKKTSIWYKLPNNEVFVINSPVSDHCIKNRIVRFKLLEYKCCFCNLVTEWNNLPLTLQLDHINGNRKDNRLENLRYLCPNCHSQTATFAGRRLLGTKIKQENEYKKTFCAICNKELGAKSKMCLPCFHESIKKQRIQKIPPHTELVKRIISSSIKQVAIELGIEKNYLSRYLMTNQLLEKIKTDSKYHPNSVSKFPWPQNDDLVKMINETSINTTAKKLGTNSIAIKRQLIRKKISHLINKKYAGIH